MYELVYMKAAIDSVLRRMNLIYFYPAARVYRCILNVIYSDRQSKGLRAALSLFLSFKGTR